jgi:hypothetical protein
MNTTPQPLFFFFFTTHKPGNESFIFLELCDKRDSVQSESSNLNFLFYGVLTPELPLLYFSGITSKVCEPYTQAKKYIRAPQQCFGNYTRVKTVCLHTRQNKRVWVAASAEPEEGVREQGWFLDQIHISIVKCVPGD